MKRSITYPPEMLPSPEEGEEAEVIVVDPECQVCGGYGAIPDDSQPFGHVVCPKCHGEGAFLPDRKSQ